MNDDRATAEQGVTVAEGRVQPEWIDLNGHMNVAYYLLAFDLAVDNKRVHQFQRMYHAETGALAATAEWMNLHVSLETRRVCAWPDDIFAAFTKVATSQEQTRVPAEVGKRMKIDTPTFALDGYDTDE